MTHEPCAMIALRKWMGVRSSPSNILIDNRVIWQFDVSFFVKYLISIIKRQVFCSPSSRSSAHGVSVVSAKNVGVALARSAWSERHTKAARPRGRGDAAKANFTRSSNRWSALESAILVEASAVEAILVSNLIFFRTGVITKVTSDRSDVWFSVYLLVNNNVGVTVLCMLVSYQTPGW